METTYKCPVCKKETIGVKNGSCGSICVCPNCQKTGNIVYMEEQKSSFYCNLGSGLYQKKNI